VVIGIVGQYLARVYDEVRNRPLYLVRQAHGFAPPDPAAGHADLLGLRADSAHARNGDVRVPPVPP